MFKTPSPPITTPQERDELARAAERDIVARVITLEQIIARILAQLEPVGGRQ